MATASTPRWLKAGAHPSLMHHFSPRDSEQMLKDDLLAGRSVSAVLVSVVAAGLLMMIVTVLIALL